MKDIEIGPIRPPSESNSLLIRVTRGCHWNKCYFCGLYKSIAIASGRRCAVFQTPVFSKKGNPMAVLFVEYPKCSTCKKAKAWLDEHGVEYIDRDIVLDNPAADELATWIARSGLPVRRFFNSSGMKYRELGLKARLDAGMTDRECYELLATDGMLVKRPLLVGDDFAIPGFREAAWAEALL